MARDLLQRPMSIQFHHKFLHGVDHSEVLKSIDAKIGKENIKSIQITEKMCIITANNNGSKEKLLTDAIEILYECLKWKKHH